MLAAQHGINAGKCLSRKIISPIAFTGSCIVLMNFFLNNCYKSITNTQDAALRLQIAKRFACANELCKGYFG